MVGHGRNGPTFLETFHVKEDTIVCEVSCQKKHHNMRNFVFMSKENTTTHKVHVKGNSKIFEISSSRNSFELFS